MHKINRTIFGKNVSITSENKRVGNFLAKELSIYPEFNNAIDKVDLEICYQNGLAAIHSGTRNPSIHHTFENGFTIGMNNVLIRYLFNENRLYRIEFAIPFRKKKGLNKLANRWMSMQFTSNEEAIGQIIHEHVLVPSVLFDEHMTLLHASGVQTPEGETILIGGTGGIGKTSMEMELCLNQGCKFMCDDIAVISDSGIVYPNLSYPKVYGYNLEGNKELEKKVLQENNFASDVHWWMHSKRGKNYVRRRIAPDQLYGTFAGKPQKLDKYYIFIREHRDDVVLENITVEQAAELSLHVIQSEYSEFFNHMQWDNYNAKAIGNTSMVGFSSLLKKMEENTMNALMYSKNYVLRIPVEMDHSEFKRKIADLLLAK